MEAQFRAYESNTLWIHLMQPCTYKSLASLQHLVGWLMKSTPLLPNIIWLDTVNRLSLKAEGKEISLLEIRKAMWDMTKYTLEVYKKLLFRKTSVWIDYETIHNVLSDTSFGYWSGEDPNNEQFHDQTILLQYILDDPGLL